MNQSITFFCYFVFFCISNFFPWADFSVLISTGLPVNPAYNVKITTNRFLVRGMMK